MIDLGEFREILPALPGVQSFRLVTEAPPPMDRGFDGRLMLRTEAGTRSFLVQVFRSHLARRTADHIVAHAAGSPEPVLILAPYVGAGLATTLTEAGVNYVDARGNCHIAAPPLFIHIEGRSGPPQKPADKGLRTAGYQVLFAYLAQPPLLDQPLRTVADMAGVSRQPVFDMRHRLLDDGYVLASGTTMRWHPRRRQDALSLWLRGYEATVRPSLILGTYRTQDANPDVLESRLANVVGEAGVSEFRWGGSAGGFRLTGHYRGERTVVHVPSTPADLPRRLRAMNDPRGNLILMNAFGDINWASGETVHPLLVYSEMLNEGSERAREAAQELYEQQLEPLWKAAAE